jgi:hypothetical protein
MKESITKFDLEAAFKALDEIEAPASRKGLKANRPALNEIFSRKSKFDSLFEEYYDVSNTEELSDAKENREAEIAKAKLARIEKIVDLDAESPEELLASYVGKFIMQCPQCMTLFYKDAEDVEESEDDPTTVNVNEVCQHCGNTSGYTLIGKVGAADEPAEEEPAAEETNGDLAEIETEDVEGTSDTEEGTEGEEASEGEEDFDLDSELAALDLDEDEEEKQEEGFSNRFEGNYLLEQLEEDDQAEDNQLEEAADLDLEISDAEFEALMNSDEFKKPISDATAQAMLDNIGESLLTCEELEEAVNATKSEEELTEGGLGLLGKTIKKKLGQVGKSIKDHASAAIDKFADDTMTREEKANWVLQNALEDYVKEVQVDRSGKLLPDKKDRKFNTFIVIGYKNYYTNGKPITVPPAMDNGDLVVGMEEPQARGEYKAADDLAKGWSERRGCGPAAIYLAKDANDPEMAFLCKYFEGRLIDNDDWLEKYFNLVKKDLEGKTLIQQGGGVTSSEGKPKTKTVKASEVKKGNIIVAGEDMLEVLEVTASKISTNHVTFKTKNADGDLETISLDNKAKVSIIDGEAKESLEHDMTLNTIMERLIAVKESEIEKLITESLTETYKNVADFRLTGCDYLNEEFRVNGKILFESGNERETTYVFSKATADNEDVTFVGLNEKLGEASFTLAGKATANNVFIAESFAANKNA